ncbi:hypothetical protein D3C80_1415570 [compost metagenome]
MHADVLNVDTAVLYRIYTFKQRIDMLHPLDRTHHLPGQGEFIQILVLKQAVLEQLHPLDLVLQIREIIGNLRHRILGYVLLGSLDDPVIDIRSKRPHREHNEQKGNQQAQKY